MANEGNALPWIPLTPDYIDKYNESVIKYLKDMATSPKEDASFSTTLTLLHQRAEQIYDTLSATPLVEAEIIEESQLKLYIRIVGADVYFLVKEGSADTTKRLPLLAYLLSLSDREFSEDMSELIARCARAESTKGLAYDIDDIIELDLMSLAEKLTKTELVIPERTSWRENKGTIAFTQDGVSLYDMNRSLINAMGTLGGSLKREQVIGNIPVSLMLDKKEKKDFSLTRYISSLQDVKPSEDIVKKKVYMEDDWLTVRIVNKGYGELEVKSIDPNYEEIKGRIVLSDGLDNVRGISLVDLSGSVYVGDHLNVVYLGDDEFSISETILEYIRKHFWVDDEKDLKYARMTARLLFPAKQQRPNTWLTEYGFTVRSGFEDIPRGEYRVLEGGSYDDDLDMLIDYEIADDVNGDEIEMFREVDAKRSLIKSMMYYSKVIKSEAAPHEVVRTVDREVVAFFHRTLALKESFDVSRTSPDYYSGCCILAAINEDSEDLKYYSVKLDYSKMLQLFAANKIDSIKTLESHGIVSVSVDSMTKTIDTLLEYGRDNESEFLDRMIDEEEDNDINTIAKLVQAANRFHGNSYLSKLLVFIHREICQILEITDSIEEKEDTLNEDFPFPPEGPYVEHKMSWVYDNDTHVFNETTQSAKIMKSICAFLNNSYAEGNGVIYIGTDDTRKNINSVEEDIKVLLKKGVLEDEANPEDEFLRHITGILIRRFPNHYENIKAEYICDNRVIRITVSPARSGLVYLNNIAYEKVNSSAKPMREDKKEQIISEKFLFQVDLADKISNVIKAIHQKTYVVLKGYSSSNSNKEDDDRKLEVYDFTNRERLDGVWAYDPKDKENKVFLLKRAQSVEILNEGWKYEKAHKTSPLDIIGYSGQGSIPLSMTLNTVSAKNLFIEQYPDAKDYLTEVGNKKWKLETVLNKEASLYAVSSFYLGHSADMDISGTPALVKIVQEQLTKLLERM